MCYNNSTVYIILAWRLCIIIFILFMKKTAIKFTDKETNKVYYVYYIDGAFEIVKEASLNNKILIDGDIIITDLKVFYEENATSIILKIDDSIYKYDKNTEKDLFTDDFQRFVFLGKYPARKKVN